MLRGLLHLTWLEIKIFVREPLGVFGTIGVPVLLFLIVGRLVGSRVRRAGPGMPPGLAADLPIFVSLFVTIGAVLSLVAIMAIYREGGILKRLRATPLRPHTILAAHVLVKLLFSAITIAAMLLAGRSYFPGAAGAPLVSFGLAVVFTTLSVLSVGFLIASVVPTARFAQPFGALVLYPMLALSGLFVPVAALPAGLQMVSRVLPLTYAVSLLRGIWGGEGWLMHLDDVAVLTLTFVVATALAGRVFRWE
jgi:ABC-2 type transport system permease protein